METNVAVAEVTTNVANTGEKFRVLVIDNRVRLYQGKEQVSYEECGSHAIALEVAAKFQKEHDATATTYGPQMSAEKRRHLDYMAKVHTADKIAKKAERVVKKAAKVIAKDKKQIAEEVDELQKRLAMLGD